MEHIVAVTTNTYHGFGTDEALRGIAAAGFRFVELTAVRGWTEHVMADMPKGELSRVRDRMEALGLSCIALSGHCNLTDAKRLDDFRANMRLAKRLGAKYIISSTGEAHFGHDEALADDELIRNVKALLPDLEENGLKLGIEVHGEYGTGEAVARIVRGVASPLVGINYDTANAVFYGGKDPLEDLRSVMELVNYVHLKDKVGMDNSWNFPALGKGELPIAEIVRTVRGTGRDIPLSVEIEFTQDYTMRDKVPADLQTADHAGRDSYTFLRREGLT